MDEYKSASRGIVKVPDPYRWLEEYTEETDNWTSAQEKFTRAYIDQYPHRQQLADAFLAAQDYAKVCRVPAQSASGYLSPRCRYRRQS